MTECAAYCRSKTMNVNGEITIAIENKQITLLLSSTNRNYSKRDGDQINNIKPEREGKRKRTYNVQRESST
jgi:hypothetical protein